MKDLSTNKIAGSRWTSLSFFILIIVAGIVIGSVIEKPLFGYKWTCFLYNTVFEKSFATVDIKNTFIILLFYVCISFIVGSSAIGQPFAYALLMNSGTVVGACAFSMYKLYGKKAVLPIIMTVLPKVAAISVITVLAVRAALKSSAALLCVYRCGDVRDGRELDFRLYCIRFIVLVFLSLIFSAAVGAFDFLYLKMCRL